MSDTPRTDSAAIRCACSTYVVPSEFARELERENAALRAISIEAMISNTAFRMKELERENTALRADLLIEEERSIYWRDNECKAMAENAALWADKERMDWLEQSQKLWEGKDSLRGPEFISRAAIDAAKEDK